MADRIPHDRPSSTSSPPSQPSGALRSSLRLSTSSFGNEFTLESTGVVDGHRPTRTDTFAQPKPASSSHAHTASTTTQNFQGYIPSIDAPSGSASPQARRSISKRARDSRIQSRAAQTGDSTQQTRPIANTDSTYSSQPLQRVSSVSTNFSMSRYQGTTPAAPLPSHPYAMYPQGTDLTRSASVTTSSTIPPPERAYISSAAPQHPYALYTQNPVAMDEGTNPTQQPLAIPIGFPGHTHQYQRRLGPDGEEIADLIGPDGHTEQLPPYTKYPDNLDAKSWGGPRPLSSGGASATASPESPRLSQDQLESPQLEDSSRSLRSESSRVPIADSSDALPPSEEKWTGRGRRKVCLGKLPLWVAILIGSLVMLVIVLGAVLGGILGSKHSAYEQLLKATQLEEAVESAASKTAAAASTIFATVTTYDAQPILTAPAGLPTLTPGGFNFPRGIDRQSNDECLADEKQAKAWSCDVQKSGAVSQMMIAATEDGPTIKLLSYDTPGNSVNYGMQAPVISQAQKLSLMTDLIEQDRGPAYTFQTFYNKVVIVRDGDFTGRPSRKRNHQSKRDSKEEEERDFEGGPGPFIPGYGTKAFSVAQPGDRPWYCQWYNTTILEGFFYVNQTSSTAASSSASASAAATSSAAAASSSSLGTYGGSALAPIYYPTQVKIVEHQLQAQAGAQAPTCRQMVILDDGNVVNATDSDGHNIIVTLNISDTTRKSTIQRRDTYIGHLLKRDYGDKPGPCRCQWMTL